MSLVESPQARRSVAQRCDGRLAQLVGAPALQAGQISSKSLLRLRLLSSSPSLACSKVDPRLQTTSDRRAREFDRIPPDNEFLVLDADSSQQRAIAAVLADQSRVIHGPPGTGKSQTITNLIANPFAWSKGQNHETTCTVSERQYHAGTTHA
jgi:putative ribosome biogenesis GTPase RsgA